MFWMYKKKYGEKLSKFITELLSLANRLHTTRDHARDNNGALDEDIPVWVNLYKEFKRLDSTALPSNAQQ